MSKKKKPAPGYAICGQCAEAIDLQALYAAQKADRPYVHYCGRVLHWGDENEKSGSEEAVRRSPPA